MRRICWTLLLILFSSSVFAASHSTQSTVADAGINLIEHGRMYLSVVWNARAVLGLCIILWSGVYWYKMGDPNGGESTASSSIWVPVIGGLIGAAITYEGGIDFLGEVLTFSGGNDALILQDGRANLTENAQYNFRQGSNTE